jgi:predicted negative regulator of RcsB-dependent stress response
MAEGLLGGILGEEAEKPEVEAAESLAGAEAFAAAVAARLSGNDPGVARKTEIFLEKQARLLEIQAEHLEDEHALRLGQLEDQKRESALRRTGIRIRIVSQLFFALLAIVIGVGIIDLFRDALTSRSVVIDAFETPPALAASGLNGKVVAAGLLDVLTKIQTATKSSAQRRHLSNAWTSDIAIEVPETGISIGEIERILRNRFGHDQHIDGDLLALKNGGLALTVRGTGILPKTFTDPDGDLEKVLTEAAEYVFGEAQPAQFASYLLDHRRIDEALRFCQAAYATADPAERPYLLNVWGDVIADAGGTEATLQALALWRESIRLDPEFWVGYNNIMYALGTLGDEEGLVQAAEQLIKRAGGRPGRAPEHMYQNYDQEVYNLQAGLASEIADIEMHGGIGTTASVGAQNLQVAQWLILLHDLDAAALRLSTTPVDAKRPADVAVAASDRAQLAEARGDLKAAAQAWDAFAVPNADPSVASSLANQICYAAVTYEKTGQSAKADAALDVPNNLHFVDCYRFRGDVLDLRGDWSGAQSWYQNAVTLGPNLPAGYYSWGVALARHGDLSGAVEKLRLANQKGPHWADPLKVWGDVLMRQGQTRLAVEKYDEAIRYAPNWQQLKEARAAAKP